MTNRLKKNGKLGMKRERRLIITVEYLVCVFLKVKIS